MDNARFTAQQYDELCEQLLEQPCHVIDFLPAQVPADRGGQYFAAERFFLAHPQVLGLYEKFANLLIQLNCYYELAVTEGEGWSCSMPPEELWARVARRGKDGTGFLNVLLPKEESLITLNSGDLYMTIYAPNDELLRIITQLAAAQGLFVRKGAC